MSATTGPTTIDVGAGLRTAYLEGGDPSGIPLVLLHDGAFGSDAESCWGGLLDAFPGYRVLAPDLLGHGGTAKVAFFDADPMTQRISHIRDFCAALGLDRPLFVGSSFGGGMILRGAASRTLAMRGGVSIGGPGGIHMVVERFATLQAYEPTLDWARATSELLVADPSEAMVEDRYQRSLTPGHYETLASARLVHPARADQAGPDWRPAYREALTTIDVPVLLIGGGDDVLLEQGWADSMAAAIPRGEALTIAGARHQPHLDHHDETLAAVLDFLGRATQDAPGA